MPNFKDVRAKSSEFLQIEGKEVKQMQKRKSLRPRKSSKPLCDKKLREKIPRDYSMPHLHDLCTTIPAQELPTDLRLASRVYHTANRKGHDTLLGKFGTSFLDDRFTDEEQTDRILYGIPVMDDNQECVHSPLTPQGIPPELAQGTRERAHKPHLQVLGEKMCAYPEFTKLFWNTAAPKFSVPVSVMKKTLYPKYESVQASRLLTDKFSYKNSAITLRRHSRTNFWCFLPRKSASFENIQKWFSAQSTQLRQVKSAVDLRKEDIVVPLEIKNDMQSSIKEVMFQKAKELKRQLQLTKQNKTEEPISVKKNINDIFDNMCEKHSLRNLSLTLIEASKKAGISYIVYPKKKKMKWKKRLKQQKLIFVYQELSKPPKSLERSTSHGILPEQKKYLFKVPLYERQIRCPSLPLYLNFEKFFQTKGGIPENIDPRTWAFDRLIAYKDASTPVKEKDGKISVPKDPPERVKEPPKLKLSDDVESDLPQEVIKHYESEVKILTEEINDKTNYPAFAYCRRGAIYRKLGKLQSAMNDLQRCIFYDPKRTDALLKRGLFYYENENWFAAMEDFTALLNIDPQNSQARTYRGIAYVKRKFYKEATQDFSAAIHFDPNNWLALYYRGCLFRKSNPFRALQDYSVSGTLPSITSLINDGYENLGCFLHRGIVYAHLKLWLLAICDFEAVISLERTTTLAYVNIGLIHLLHLDNYTEAIWQFSEAIRIDPLCIQSYLCRAETYFKVFKA
ncbi:hypothetical protein H8957_010838 [Semnopithecus entellus]